MTVLTLVTSNPDAAAAAPQAFFQNRIFALALMAAGAALIVFGIILLFIPAKKGRSRKYTGEIAVFSRSVIGDRKYQQDYCLFPKNIMAEQVRKIGMLAAVCDGMGGMEGGERASRCCAETVYSGYYQIGATDNICALLKDLILEADKEVSNFTDESGRRLNSGTTVVAAVYLNSKIYWASVGDSRIYHWHNGELHQITRDHNLRLRLLKDLENGLISREQFDAAKQKEALISYVGKGRELIVDTGELDFPAGSDDVLILCSDGVYKTASEKTLCKILKETTEFEKVPAAVTDAAMAGGQSGKHDNISLIAIKRN